MRDDQPVEPARPRALAGRPGNPLVARVAVNRLWEQMFGRGLVETSEDFGSQGTPPSHPELLDWLATEFVAKGWSQKALIRDDRHCRPRTGSRQPVTPQLAERDPYNRLLARGPRVRMEAEMIRDVALAASGLLSDEDVRPERLSAAARRHLEPALQLATNGRRATGEDRYRRSLYTFWRRTSPYPSFMTFDATSRELCTVRRVRTNTPLQALTLLNDPASFEAARALARRMIAARRQPGGARRATASNWCSRARQRRGELERLVAPTTRN